MSGKAELLAYTIITINWIVIIGSNLALILSFSNTHAIFQKSSNDFEVLKKSGDFEQEDIDNALKNMNTRQEDLRQEALLGIGEMMLHWFLNCFLGTAVYKENFNLVMLWIGYSVIAMAYHTTHVSQHYHLITALGWTTFEFAVMIWMILSCLGIMLYGFKLFKTGKKNSEPISDMKV